MIELPDHYIYIYICVCVCVYVLFTHVIVYACACDSILQLPRAFAADAKDFAHFAGSSSFNAEGVHQELTEPLGHLSSM